MLKSTFLAAIRNLRCDHGRATDQMTATLGEKYRFGSKFAWNRIGRSCFAIGKRFVLRRGDQESTCAFFESRIIICDALV